MCELGLLQIATAEKKRAKIAQKDKKILILQRNGDSHTHEAHTYICLCPCIDNAMAEMYAWYTWLG